MIALHLQTTNCCLKPSHTNAFNLILQGLWSGNNSGWNITEKAQNDPQHPMNTHNVRLVNPYVHIIQDICALGTLCYTLP